MSAASQSVEIGASEAFDTERLKDYLRAHIPALSGGITIRRFNGGQSNPTFLLDDDTGHALVLRKKPGGPIHASAHQVEREYRILKALAPTGVPVPGIHLLCEDDAIVGTPFYVMDHVDGRIHRDTALPGLTPDARRAIYLSMAGTLGTLHGVDLAAAGLTDYGRPGDYFRRQIGRWGRQVAANAPADTRALIAWLDDNVPPEHAPTIVHGDFRLENLIFAGDTAEILAVLDWELSTLGDPMADLAYNCLPFHLPGDLKGLGGIQGRDLAQLGIPGEQDYVAAYCAATGRAAIPHWNFYLAFSLFRTSAILQGVYERAQNANAASADALEVGGNYARVAAIGLAIAHRPAIVAG